LDTTNRGHLRLNRFGTSPFERLGRQEDLQFAFEPDARVAIQRKMDRRSPEESKSRKLQQLVSSTFL
jgi:hypothetical protein